MNFRLLICLLFVFIFVCNGCLKNNEGSPPNVQPIVQKSDSLAAWLAEEKTLLKEACGYNDACRVERYKKIIDQLWRTPTTKEEYKQVAALYSSCGYSLTQEKKFYKAKNIYELFLADSNFVNTKSSDYISEYIHSNLGAIYTRLGEYEQAEISLQINLANTKDKERQASIHSDLGSLYMSKGDLSNAISWFKEGLQIEGISEATKGLLHSNLLRVFKAQKRYDRAIEEGRSAIFWLKNYEELHADWLSNIYASLAESYVYWGDHAQSIQMQQSALQYLKKAYGDDPYNRDVAKIYISLGDADMEMGNETKALNSFQRALNAVLPSVPLNWQANPNEALLYPENAIVEALYGKTKALATLYTQEKEAAYLEAALEAYDLVLKAEYGLRQTYQLENSQLLSAENMRSYSEGIIKILFQAYQHTNSEQYARKAFEITERTKAVVLKERLSSLFAKNSYLPQNLQEEDWDYQSSLNELYQYLALHPNQNNDSIYQAIATQSANYAIFLNNMEAAYPNYVRSKQTILGIDIQAIKNNLHNNQTALVEYFWGEANQFAFIITKNKPLQFIELLPAADSILTAFENALRQPDFSADGFQGFTNASHQLFKSYFEDLPLDEATKNLIIVPDGELQYFPFAAFIDDIPDVKMGQYHKLPYLGLDYVFSYSYSADIWLELQARQQGKRNAELLGIAPPFNNLAYNQKEVEAIQYWYPKGKTITDYISKAKFIQESANYGILHLATHANAHDDRLQESAIYLGDDTLSLKDIYTLPLNAQMVVLSACQTGTGEIRRGEGVLSLARAFMYQGCPSVVATLWNANDESAFKITTSFYENLKAGQAKSLALTKAQNDYLTTASTQNAHPFYWSALTLVGTDAPILERSIHFGWIVGIVGVLLIGFLLRRSDIL